MPVYPGGVYSPRTKENKAGIVYNAAKTTIGYAEDITKLDDEVVAVQTELGTNPKGIFASVKARLEALVPYTGAVAEVDLGAQKLITTNTITGSSFMASGDADTYLTFPSADKFRLYVGGEEFIHTEPGLFIINRFLRDIDFSIRSDNNSNMLFVDAGNDRVGIGTGAPAEIFHVLGTLTKTALFESPSASLTRIDIKNTGAGDPVVAFMLGGTTKWSVGCDNSDDDSFVIAPSHFLHNTPALRIDRASQDVKILNDLDVVKRISSGTLTFAVVGPTDNLDVSGVNTVFIDADSNHVTIGGLVGGVDGQILRIVRCCASAFNVTLEHAEGGGNQDILLHAGADETLFTEYGGWVLVCNGVDWFDVSHAKHT